MKKMLCFVCLFVLSCILNAKPFAYEFPNMPDLPSDTPRLVPIYYEATGRPITNMPSGIARLAYLLINVKPEDLDRVLDAYGFPPHAYAKQ